MNSSFQSAAERHNAIVAILLAAPPALLRNAGALQARIEEMVPNVSGEELSKAADDAADRKREEGEVYSAKADALRAEIERRRREP